MTQLQLPGEARTSHLLPLERVWRKPWIVSDMLSDPLFAAAKEASVKSGIRAAFSVPVITADGRVLGSLACHIASHLLPWLTKSSAIICLPP
jgi:GAF domain-containing protein